MAIMPTDARRFRYNADDWDDLRKRVPEGNRSAVIAQFLDWYLCKPYAKLPERPDGPPATPNPRKAAKEAAIEQFSAWYDRKPGADLPDRPPKT